MRHSRHQCCPLHRTDKTIQIISILKLNSSNKIQKLKRYGRGLRFKTCRATARGGTKPWWTELRAFKRSWRSWMKRGSSQRGRYRALSQINRHRNMMLHQHTNRSQYMTKVEPKTSIFRSTNWRETNQMKNSWLGSGSSLGWARRLEKINTKEMIRWIRRYRR